MRLVIDDTRACVLGDRMEDHSIVFISSRVIITKTGSSLVYSKDAQRSIYEPVVYHIWTIHGVDRLSEWSRPVFEVSLEGEFKLRDSVDRNSILDVWNIHSRGSEL